MQSTYGSTNLNIYEGMAYEEYSLAKELKTVRLNTDYLINFKKVFT